MRKPDRTAWVKRAMGRSTDLLKGAAGLALVFSQLACRLAILGLEQPVPLTPSPTATVFSTRTFTPTPTRTATPTPPPTNTPPPTWTPTPILLVEEGTQVPNNLPSIRMEDAWKVSALAEWSEPSVSDLEWMPDEGLLAVSNSTSINLYDVETRRILRTLYPSKEGIVDFAFSPGGLWLVVGTRQGDEQKGYASSLELWSGPNWRPLGLLYGVTSGLNEMTFTPKGDYFAVVYANPQYNSGVIDFWQTTSWSLNTSMDAGAILNVAISADGIYLATSPNRYNIQIWDLERHEFIYRIPTSFTGAVNRLVFAPDSGVLASGHYDGMVRLWDLNTSELLLEFDTGAVVESLAFSPDGLILATGGSFEHSNIQLWSAGSGALLRVLDNPSGGIHRLSFSPDGQYLVSASYDGSLRLWGIRP